ncbi:uncharacterized protein LOC119079736 [Bradysia coprophila]|uniref:uncharacterized protein LOC119079736 n=1 Tax=Bradysia coprophila TaxID=38358 RepID=UPI00187DA4E6|nr:uncharacterized protein LOC119079736 [Bradysia coprophila]
MSALRSNFCPICRKSENLRRCQGCMVMLYCCREHQTADRITHEVACDKVKNARIVHQLAERFLRAEPPSFMLPANVFETGVGRFWDILDTRNYMRTRYLLVEYLIEIKTYDAVKAALNHALEMLRLCRKDNLRLRFTVPALFIRLGNDQECYDFMKWHTTTGASDDYDWEDMDQPFLDVTDADVSEPVDVFTGRLAHMEFAVALMLIKIKFLRDVRTLQYSLFMYDQVPLPMELTDRIRKEAIDGTIVSKRKDLFISKNLNPLIETLLKQMKQLFDFVQTGNKYIWPGLIDPKDYLDATPACQYSEASEDHAQVTVQHYYEAYEETSDAIKVIKEMVELDSRS